MITVASRCRPRRDGRPQSDAAGVNAGRRRSDPEGSWPGRSPAGRDWSRGRCLAGRWWPAGAGPLFLSEYRPGRHRHATIDPRDICPVTSRARLGYDRARILLGHYGDGLRLHQLRHSAATHLGEAGIDATVIMAKTGHKSLRTLQRYVRPGLTAVHQATESLSSPRRRG